MSLIQELLQKTSRTFALSIPLLPESLQRSVSVAYLLFRIADTIEDEFPEYYGARRYALQMIADRFTDAPDVMCDILETLPFDHNTFQNSGYADLLKSTDVLMKEYLSLSSGERSAIASHLSRTCRGMAHYLGRDLSTGTLQNLKEYCYIVAGIVGEMLTELFVLHDPDLSPSRQYLLRQSSAFGEGLQLVNIIRDATNDLHAGRCYLPLSLDRASLIGLARGNLNRAQDYIRILHDGNCHPGIVQFNALNLALAVATIDAIQEHGPGTKLSRDEVHNILNHVKTHNFFATSAFGLD